MIEIVIGVLRNPTPGTREYLIGKRRGPLYEACWELPGGKVEPDETHGEALAREWQEELGWSIVMGDRLFEGLLEGHDGSLFRATAYLVSPSPQEGSLCWWTLHNILAQGEDGLLPVHSALGWRTSEELVGLIPATPTTHPVAQALQEYEARCAAPKPGPTEPRVERIVAELRLREHWPDLVWSDACQGCGVDGCVPGVTDGPRSWAYSSVMIEVQTGRGPDGDFLLIRDNLANGGAYGKGDYWNVPRTPEVVAEAAAKIKSGARELIVQEERAYIARRHALEFVAGVRP